MATKYIRRTTRIDISPSSDYSSAVTYEPDVDDEVTATTADIRRQVAIGTAAPETLSVAMFSSITRYLVKNLDPSNYVTHTYKSTAGGATITQRIAAKGELELTDVDPAQDPTLQANGAAVLVDVVLVGET